MDRIIQWEAPADGIATLNLDRAIREGSQYSYDSIDYKPLLQSLWILR